MRTIEEQRRVEIRPGFSPKPLTLAEPEMGTSPSMEPDSPSPTAQLDGLTIQRSHVAAPLASDLTVKDGIVSFGK